MCSSCEREKWGKHEGDGSSGTNIMMKEDEQVLQVQSWDCPEPPGCPPEAHYGHSGADIHPAAHEANSDLFCKTIISYSYFSEMNFMAIVQNLSQGLGISNRNLNSNF